MTRPRLARNESGARLQHHTLNGPGKAARAGYRRERCIRSSPRRAKPQRPGSAHRTAGCRRRRRPGSPKSGYRARNSRGRSSFLTRLQPSAKRGDGLAGGPYPLPPRRDRHRPGRQADSNPRRGAAGAGALQRGGFGALAARGGGLDMETRARDARARMVPTSERAAPAQAAAPSRSIADRWLAALVQRPGGAPAGAPAR
jgi:hypothetical protein